MKLNKKYLLKGWGGFWNENNLKIHKEPYFKLGKIYETRLELEKERDRLTQLTKNPQLDNDAEIAFMECEGYLLNYDVTIVSKVIWNEKIHTVINNLGTGWLDSDLEYMVDWKWDIAGVDIENEPIPEKFILICSYLDVKERKIEGNIIV